MVKKIDTRIPVLSGDEIINIPAAQQSAAGYINNDKKIPVQISGHVLKVTKNFQSETYKDDIRLLRPDDGSIYYVENGNSNKDDICVLVAGGSMFTIEQEPFNMNNLETIIIQDDGNGPTPKGIFNPTFPFIIRNTTSIPVAFSLHNGAGISGSMYHGYGILEEGTTTSLGLDPHSIYLVTKPNDIYVSMLGKDVAGSGSQSVQVPLLKNGASELLAKFAINTVKSSPVSFSHITLIITTNSVDTVPVILSVKIPCGSNGVTKIVDKTIAYDLAPGLNSIQVGLQYENDDASQMVQMHPAYGLPFGITVSPQLNVNTTISMSAVIVDINANLLALECEPVIGGYGLVNIDSNPENLKVVENIYIKSQPKTGLSVASNNGIIRSLSGAVSYDAINDAINIGHKPLFQSGVYDGTGLAQIIINYDNAYANDMVYTLESNAEILITEQLPSRFTIFFQQDLSGGYNVVFPDIFILPQNYSIAHGQNSVTEIEFITFDNGLTYHGFERGRVETA
jgi:hypothetical protein